MVEVGEGSLQLLGLRVDEAGDEVYDVSFRPTPDARAFAGHLRHDCGTTWALDDGTSLSLGTPDEVFALALGPRALTAEAVARSIPHWPTTLQTKLARRHVSGAGSIAFDVAWFLSKLTTSPIDRPLLFPGAAAKLGLSALGRASEALTVAAAREGAHDEGLVQLLMGALAAETRVGTGPDWAGEGRLIGESTWGDLAQVGTDIADGCRAALGTGPLLVAFEPDTPMGVGFGPQVPSEAAKTGVSSERNPSMGTGAEVGEVEPRGIAESAGVRPGMVVTGLSAPERVLGQHGVAALTFEEVLDAIDAARDAGETLLVTFDTAAPLCHLYAVEMPAASALAAFAAAGGAVDEAPDDAGVGAPFDALCGASALWREPIPRLFVGAAGSVTCAHTDICPQLQLAHGLSGTKVLGVGSHRDTERLRAGHGGEEGGDEEVIDDGATHVPTDRPLSSRQAELLDDSDITLVWLQAGDLAVFHSGAMHFASNGASGCSSALFHGLITPAVVPRLRAAAASEGAGPSDGDYGEHLFATDLLRIVEGRLASRPTPGS